MWDRSGSTGSGSGRCGRSACAVGGSWRGKRIETPGVQSHNASQKQPFKCFLRVIGAQKGLENAQEVMVHHHLHLLNAIRSRSCGTGRPWSCLAATCCGKRSCARSSCWRRPSGAPARSGGAWRRKASRHSRCSWRPSAWRKGSGAPWTLGVSDVLLRSWPTLITENGWYSI